MINIYIYDKYIYIYIYIYISHKVDVLVRICLKHFSLLLLRQHLSTSNVQRQF